MAPRKLSEYRAKRDFENTPEPEGAPAKAAGHSYLIQKHASRRLHFDLRLEMDGVLKSWAVTRGPSLDPADKRLAVHVEDHPLEYGSFEGIIPQGEYGGGTVMLWDQGTWKPIGDEHLGYEKGHLSFTLFGKRLKGEWHLVRMRSMGGERKDNWLLIKGDDAYAKPKNGDFAVERFGKSVASHRSMEQIAEEGGQPILKSKRRDPPKAAPRNQNNVLPVPPDFVAPQLATLVSDPPNGPNWMHEVKFDGYRALGRIAGGRVQMLTRANNDWTDKFRSIADVLEELPVDNVLIDGEIIAVKSDGAMSFAALQQTLSGERHDSLHYFVFDILFLNGRDLRKVPQLERKELLRALLPKKHPLLHYSEHFTEPGGLVLSRACDIALEGIVSKRIDAPYVSGRTRAWLKSKCVNEQEFVIGGFTYQPKHAGVLGALLIGYFKGEDLIFAGKVGTGFTESEARNVLRQLKPDIQKTSPFKSVPARERHGALWVVPRVAAEVSFTEWTAGGSLRHPSYHGLRIDKPVKQIVRESEEPPPAEAPAPRRRGEYKPKIRETETEGVTLSHPDKILFPDVGLTKEDLARYYERVAPLILPHIARRPISLVRCPEGSKKECFFQRHVGEGMPAHIFTTPIKINEERDYLYIENLQGLLELVQMGVLEIHIWGTHIDHVDYPDRMVFDLDPAEDVPWSNTKEAAREVQRRLKKQKLQSYLEATGGKGLHVVVPFEPAATWDAFSDFAFMFATELARSEPNLYTVSPRKTNRVGKIFIDYLRNKKGSSSIAPYSTRARPGAPIALPLTWRELDALENAHPLSMASVLADSKKVKNDPWKNMEKIRQNIPS